jgi:hypothetical protein
MATRNTKEKVDYGWGAPGKVETDQTWTFIHCPVGKDLRLLILSEKPLYWSSHWFGNTNVVCSGIGCELCARASKPVRRFLISVWDFDLCGRCVFEVGETTIGDISNHLRGQTTGRGLCFTIWRDGRSKRSRICAKPLEGAQQLLEEEFADVETREIKLPNGQDLSVVYKAIVSRKRTGGGAFAGGVDPEETGERNLSAFDVRASKLADLTHSMKSGSGNGLERL